MPISAEECLASLGKRVSMETGNSLAFQQNKFISRILLSVLAILKY